MNKINFSDWQEMALKKDVEDIKKKVHSQEPLLFSLCWEIAIALGSIIVDHLFDTEAAPIWIWVLVIIVAVLPPLFVIIFMGYHWIVSINSAKSGKLNIRSFVDLFDNQISYWVMLSNSYADMLTDVVNNPEAITSDAEKEFLYREGCYYNNKSMHALYTMKSNFHKIFSADIDEVKKYNLIDLERLHNILSVMHEQQIQLNRDIGGINNPSIQIQNEINKKYTQELLDFLNDLGQSQILCNRQKRCK